MKPSSIAFWLGLCGASSALAAEWYTTSNSVYECVKVDQQNPVQDIAKRLDFTGIDPEIVDNIVNGQGVPQKVTVRPKVLSREHFDSARTMGANTEAEFVFYRSEVLCNRDVEAEKRRDEARKKQYEDQMRAKHKFDKYE